MVARKGGRDDDVTRRVRGAGNGQERQQVWVVWFEEGPKTAVAKTLPADKKTSQTFRQRIRSFYFGQYWTLPPGLGPLRTSASPSPRWHAPPRPPPLLATPPDPPRRLASAAPAPVYSPRAPRRSQTRRPAPIAQHLRRRAELPSASRNAMDDSAAQASPPAPQGKPAPMDESIAEEKQIRTGKEQCQLRFLIINGESFRLFFPAATTVQHVKQKIIDAQPKGTLCSLRVPTAMWLRYGAPVSPSRSIAAPTPELVTPCFYRHPALLSIRLHCV